MSSYPYHLLPDHDTEPQPTQGDWHTIDSDTASPISAEPGGRDDVMATKVAFRNGRVVFVSDVELFVYRSYPISVSLRPGPSTAAFKPRLNLRSILVEPRDLWRSGEFKESSVVYAIWPNSAAWCEKADFKLRHGDNLEKYYLNHENAIQTSLLKLPPGCELRLDGIIRPLEGYLRSPLTDKRAAGQGEDRVQIRSALFLDPVRVAPRFATGRRANQRIPDTESASAEDWHWGVVQDYDQCLAELLKDDEVCRFKENVMKSEFLTNWFRSNNDIRFPSATTLQAQLLGNHSSDVPLTSQKANHRPAYWWLLDSELIDETFVDENLAAAARYALAGPSKFEAYRDDMTKRAKFGRRAGGENASEPLVYPLLQNIYADWLYKAHRRIRDKQEKSENAEISVQSESPTSRKRQISKMSSSLLAKEREKIDKLTGVELGNEVVGILTNLAQSHRESAFQDGSELEDDREISPLDIQQAGLAAIAVADKLDSLVGHAASAEMLPASVRAVLAAAVQTRLKG